MDGTQVRGGGAYLHTPTHVFSARTRAIPAYLRGPFGGGVKELRAHTDIPPTCKTQSSLTPSSRHHL